MNNNFRPAKKSELERFVDNIFNDHKVHSFVNYEIRSFYFEFFFSLPNDESICDRIDEAFEELFERGIIAEPPDIDIEAHKNASKVREMFIHSFIIDEEASKVDE